MDYYSELIDLYNNLKTKKISLVEKQSDKIRNPAPKQASPTAITIANSYIDSARGKVTSLPPENKVLVTQFPGTSVWVAVDGKAKGFVVFDGFPGGRNQPVDPKGPNGRQNFRDFALLFSSSEVSADNGDSEVNGVNGVNGDNGSGTIIAPSPFPWWPTIDLLKSLGVVNFKASPTGLLSRIADSIKGNKDNFINAIIKRLKGDNGNYSLAKSVDNHAIVKFDSGVGKFTKSTSGDENQEIKDTVGRTLKRVLELLEKNALNDIEKEELKKSILLTPKKEIIIKEPISDGDGVLIQDDLGFYKQLFEAAEELHNFKLETVSSSKFSKESLRGNFMEDISLLVHYNIKCKTSKDIDRCLKKKAITLEKCLKNKEALQQIFKELELAENSLEDGVVIPLGSDALMFAEMRRILGNNSPDKLINHLLSFAIKEHTLRNPDYFIPTGNITGYGRKADTLEVYSTREQALNALHKIRQDQKQGFEKLLSISEEDAKYVVEELNLKDLCNDNNKKEHCPDNLSRKYFTIAVSIKNALELKPGCEDVNMGVVAESSRRKMLLNEKSLDPEKQKLAQKQREAAASFLNIDKFGDPESSVSIELKEMEKTMAHVDELCAELGKKHVIGDTITMDTLLDIAGTLSNGLKKKHDYKIISDDIITELNSYISNYEKQQEKTKTDVDRRKISSMIATCIQGSIIKNMIKGRDESAMLTAKRYVSVTIFMGGGSVDHSLFSGRSLEDGSQYLCTQNSLLSIARDWIINPKDFTFDIDLSGKKMSIATKDGQKIETESRVRNGKKSTNVYVNFENIQKQSFSKP